MRGYLYTLSGRFTRQFWWVEGPQAHTFYWAGCFWLPDSNYGIPQLIRSSGAFSEGKTWHHSVVNGAANQQDGLRNTRRWGGKGEAEHAFVTDHLTSGFMHQKREGLPQTGKRKITWTELGMSLTWRREPTMNRLSPKARRSSSVLRK